MQQHGDKKKRRTEKHGRPSERRGAARWRSGAGAGSVSSCGRGKWRVATSARGAGKQGRRWQKGYPQSQSPPGFRQTTERLSRSADERSGRKSRRRDAAAKKRALPTSHTHLPPRGAIFAAVWGQISS